ncbi:ABC transporter permease [Salinithrix halophila]|uniref:ABC transporter permease n=1 Tax=Salinithrix halophila TaxID=1485204 RepID=A0ABV8JBL5_9BACL
MKSIVRKELKIMVKEKGNFFFLIVMPILFIVMFGSIFGNQNDTITVHYADRDVSKTSEDFLDRLKHIDGFKLKSVKASSDKTLIQQIRDGKLASLLVIPKGFGKELQTGKPVDLRFYRDAAATDTSAPIQAVLENLANGYRDQKLSGVLAAMGKTGEEADRTLQPPIRIREVKETTTHTDAVTQIVPGYTVMFVFFIMMTMVSRFHKDKESGMVSRLRSTPVKPLEYLLGMWIPALIMVLIQCTVLLGFGHIFYDLHLGDLVAIALLVLCLAICGTGMGLALSLWVKGENQGLAFTQLITLGGAVVAGLWFPYDMLPTFAQAIGKFTPQYWAQTGLQDVMIRGAHIGDILPMLLILLAFGAGGILIALMRYKQFLRSAAS